MKDFLFEVYTEEIPARLLNDLTAQLKTLALNRLGAYNLPFGEVRTFSTPRRLVLFIKNVEERELETKRELKGPSYEIAFNEDGKGTKALQKFLESNNLREEEIQIKEVKGNKYVFGYKTIEGRNATVILKDVALYALKNLTFHRGMRWNDSNVIFIRPIRSLLALFGNEIVDIEYAGIKSNNKSYGFFFDSPLEFVVDTPVTYFKKLRELYVVLDYNERREIVVKNVSNLAKSVSGKVKFEEDFLEEVVNLTEFPTPFLCELHTDKCEIPDCIIESIVKGHLKSFPVLSSDGEKLLPYFIGVRNGSSDFIENVRAGYEKVARARLYDGAFFFKEDRKVPLDKQVEKLKEIVFIKGLGTLYDKTLRLVEIAKYLSNTIKMSKESEEKLLRACYLSRADVPTQVVREFPELQGTIGERYARLQGEKEEVAKSLREQYLPRYIDDELPETDLGKYLGIIDRLDTLVMSIASKIEFSASKDPFGLRKSALQIVQVSFALNSAQFPFENLIKYISTLIQDKEGDTTAKTVCALLKERANYFIRSKGISYDSANAVTTLPVDMLPTFLERATVLEKHAKDERFLNIVTVHKRIRNILEKGEKSVAPVRVALFFEKEETDLFESATESERLIEALLQNRDYEAIIQLLYLLVPVVNNFFDRVLVMDKEEDIKNNRLALLSKVKGIFEKFANFSEVVIEG